MRFLRVIKPGYLTSIQDLGRRGFASSGVSEAGAADSYSLRIGNHLVGNPEGVAALEMTLVGGIFEILSEVVLAITGSDFAAEIDGRPLPLWESFLATSGQTLSIGVSRTGARCYLCVSGGIDVPVVMRSRSTHLPTHMGGLDGRALQEGDILSTSGSRGELQKLVGRNVKNELIPDYRLLLKLRVILGPEDDYFERASIERFFSSEYTITENSDRVGLRLDGPRLKHSRGADIPSEGVTIGAIQVPSDGLPIILFVERPTTGGYAKIGSVASVDLPRLGQAKPRDRIRFELISLEKAVDLYREQEGLISAIQFS